MTATRTQPIIAVAAVLSLAFWFVEIERAFGLPAHPLLIHVPLVFIPILGLAVLAVAATDRWQVPVAAYSVLTLAATLLAAGAGEAFLETRDQELRSDPTMQDHADAGDLLRFTVFAITVALVALLFTKPNAARLALRVLLGLLALVAIFYVFRVGHLGAEVAWGDPETR
jgi:uncharacterized membrane protein